MARFRTAAIAILLVLVVDVVTKLLTHHYLPLMDSTTLWYPYGGIGVFHNFFGIEFSLSHTTNTGTAWGLLHNWQGLLMALRCGLLVGLVTYLVCFNKEANMRVPLALIIAGALGNIIDYFVYGHVVDMIHFVFWGYDYPVFNIADSAIFCGVAAMLVLSFVNDRRQAAEGL